MTNSGTNMHLLLGGTFDPVHHGHLRVALELAELWPSSLVHLTPCARPPHRGAPGAAPEQRLAMLQLAVSGEPRLCADGRELLREGASYTVDTLASLRAELGRKVSLALVVGMDAFAGLASWHQWLDIPRLAHIIVVQRPGYTLDPASVPGQLLSAHAQVIAGDLLRQSAGLVFSRALPLLDISASDIRQRLASGRSPRYLLPDSVYAFIQRQQLYRPSV